MSVAERSPHITRQLSGVLRGPGLRPLPLRAGLRRVNQLSLLPVQGRQGARVEAFARRGQAAGLLPEDIVLRIDGKPCANPDEAASCLRGKQGKIELVVQRGGERPPPAQPPSSSLLQKPKSWTVKTEPSAKSPERNSAMTRFHCQGIYWDILRISQGPNPYTRYMSSLTAVVIVAVVAIAVVGGCSYGCGSNGSSCCCCYCCGGWWL